MITRNFMGMTIRLIDPNSDKGRQMISRDHEATKENVRAECHFAESHGAPAWLLYEAPSAALDLFVAKAKANDIFTLGKSPATIAAEVSRAFNLGRE